MKNYFILILFAAIVAMFFVGRWTAPSQDDQAEIDSLKRSNAEAWRLLELSLDSMRYHKARAEEYYNQAQKSQQSKTRNQVTYEKNIVRIDHYTPDQIDSAFSARYPDSSNLSPSGRP